MARQSLLRRPSRAPKNWKLPCASSECTLHQLAPYIGKLKSSIAAELLERYSVPGELVVDPFAGAGTIPYEAMLRGRAAFAADISPYARILSLGKLNAPPSIAHALAAADYALKEAKRIPRPDLRKVPQWVRHFFHPETLREALCFAEVARRPGNEFLMACFLGILHHQRPGFLSYPSSHLVPYLRTKKFPRRRFPEMYSYRALEPRLLKKIQRMYRRPAPKTTSPAVFRQEAVEVVRLPRAFDAVISSPPYMNALDYGRDNRLRLWFIDPHTLHGVNDGATRRRAEFVNAMTVLAKKIEQGLRNGGHCVFVVGDTLRRTYEAHPSEVVVTVMSQHAPSLRLIGVVADDIPDVRRIRREFRGVKTEHVLVFRRWQRRS